MNNEQKQRMTHELGQWNAAMKSSCSVSDLLAISTRMAALLQELIEQPTSVPEPAAKVLHVDGLLSNNLIDCDLPVGTLLYTAPVPALLVRDAERYRWLRNWTRGAYGIDSNPAFILPHVPTVLDQNIMSGSVAQHLDNAIDAAIERYKKGDQS